MVGPNGGGLQRPLGGPPGTRQGQEGGRDLREGGGGLGPEKATGGQEKGEKGSVVGSPMQEGQLPIMSEPIEKKGNVHTSK